MSVIQIDGSGVVVKGNQGMEGMAYDAATNTLYGAINGDFFTVDPGTGNRLTSLPRWPDDTEGLAFVSSVGSEGSVYGVDDDSDLYRYDVAFGVFTFIGDLGLGSASDNSGLAYAPDLDVLFHITKTTGNLYKIDKDTAVATFIANTGITGFSGLAYGPGARTTGDFTGAPVSPTEPSDPAQSQEEQYPGDLMSSQQVVTSEVELSQTSLTTLGDSFLLKNLPDLPLTIPPLGSVSFDVNFVPYELIDYNTTLLIISDDRDEPEVEVRLTGTGILDYLEIAPDANFVFSGHPGGPFMPTNTFYQLTNISPNDIDWNVVSSVPWLDVSPAGGTLKPGESTTVTVTPNSQADAMPEGVHDDWVIFHNITTGLKHMRKISLNVYTEPKIWATPTSFEVTIPSGDSETRILTIGNTGGSALEFSLSGQQMGFAPPAEDQEISSVPPGYDFATLGDDSSYKPGELLVRFAPKPNGKQRDKKEKEQILSSLGWGTIKYKFKLVPGLNVVKLPKGHKVKDALKKLSKKSDILYAQPNYKLTIDSDISQYFPNDPLFDDLWGMHNTGQSGGTPGADINAPEAWYIRTAADGIIVAVIDTGVDYTHPDLAANMWVNEAELNGTPGVDDDGNGYIDDIYGYDFCNNDGDPWDDHYHGTHCAGTIGAVGDNGIGVTGVCWDVKIMALKWIDAGGNGWTDDAIDCVEYSILMGANLSSNSWRQENPSVPNPALEDAINRAGAAGLLFVASAGNDNVDNDVIPHYPSSYGSDSVIAVLATDKYDNKSSFSCYGLTSVDLGAPGSGILSCEPGNRYQYLNGTSMATPHVAGACALVWSVCPSLTNLQVKDIILQTVDLIPALSGRCVSEGRLNLYKAILEAQETPCSGGGPSPLWLDFVPGAGTVAAGDTIDVNVIFDADCNVGTYQGWIDISSNDPYQGSLPIMVTMTVVPIDYFTELFDPNGNDMTNRTLTFRPDVSGSYYSLCSNEALDFPVDPNGGTIISLGDDDYVPVDLNGAHVHFYGTDYDTFYIGSNGYISFISGDIFHIESLTEHFDLPRISPLFDDLDPSAGGLVSLKQFDDRVVVTFENVPEYSMSNSNSFQVEMRFGGKIRVTLLDVAAEDGLVGLSDGDGLSAYFNESDLSGYDFCTFECDLNGDQNVDLTDFAIFASYWQMEKSKHKDKDKKGKYPWCEECDFDQSSVIDVYDLLILAERWLE